MVITKDGAEVSELKRRYGTNKDYINLYVIAKEKRESDAVIMDGFEDIKTFFKKYILKQKIWSKEVVQDYLNTKSSYLWRKAIVKTYPNISHDLDSVLANVSGMALLDFLILDDNRWSLDNLAFEDITENIQFKLYEKLLLVK